MSKKLQTFLFGAVSFVIVAGIGLGGYFLVNNLATVTISDLRILAYDGTPIRNTDVYLQDSAHNQFNIKVKVESTGTNAVMFESSDRSVARIFSASNGYVVKYYKAGKARITAYSAATSAVYDSFDVTVHEDFVANIVIDGKLDNVLEVYGNGQTKEFDYVASGVLDSYANNALIRVVDDYNKEIIKNVSIDTKNKKVYIDTNLSKESNVETINLQSYYVDSNGKEHVAKNFSYTVNVVGYDIKEIQLVISQDHYFKDKSHIFLSSSILTPTATDDELKAHLVDAEAEKAVREIYLTNDVNTIYFLTRIIYTDGTYEYPSVEGFSSGTTLYIEAKKPTNDSGNWAAQVNQAAVASLTDSKQDTLSISFTIRKTVDDRTISVTKMDNFVIWYLDEGSAKDTEVRKTKLYDYNVDEQYYEYIYWDSRYRRTDAITDADQRVIDFNCPEADKPDHN